jgi:hypothetical protein
MPGGGWEPPDGIRPGEGLHAHWENIKGTSNKQWHGAIRVKAFN